MRLRAVGQRRGGTAGRGCAAARRCARRPSLCRSRILERSSSRCSGGIQDSGSRPIEQEPAQMQGVEAGRSSARFLLPPQTALVSAGSAEVGVGADRGAAPRPRSASRWSPRAPLRAPRPSKPRKKVPHASRALGGTDPSAARLASRGVERLVGDLLPMDDRVPLRSSLGASSSSVNLTINAGIIRA